ncbi:MAG: gluconokinase [Gemmatimonadota bacterium]
MSGGGRRGALAVVLMGVTGSGKTTVGQLLASDLGWPFHDADDFHPQANVRKMARGVPLDDGDRAPWLARLSEHLDDLLASGSSSVLACSALKQRYRDALGNGRPTVRFVYLKGSEALIGSRLAGRQHRYMPASLLRSQFDALEEPVEALVVDTAGTPRDAVRRIRQGLGI